MNLLLNLLTIWQRSGASLHSSSLSLCFVSLCDVVYFMAFSITIPPPKKTGLEFMPIAKAKESQGQIKQIINLGSHF